MASRFHVSTLGLAVSIASGIFAPVTGCAEGEEIDPGALGDGSVKHGAGVGGSTGTSMQSLPAGGAGGTSDPGTGTGGSNQQGGSAGSGTGGNLTDASTPGTGGSAGQSGSAGTGGTAAPMDATIVPPDAPLAKGVVVTYHANNTNPMDDNITFFFQVINNGTTAIPLSALKIRYYFTDELNGNGRTSIYESFVVTYPTEVSRVNYQQSGITKATVTRVALANSYLEFTVNSADELKPAFALTMQVAYAATAGQPLDETNDYSANLAQTTYAPTTKMVAFQGDTIIAGAAPPY